MMLPTGAFVRKRIPQLRREIGHLKAKLSALEQELAVLESALPQLPKESFQLLSQEPDALPRSRTLQGQLCIEGSPSKLSGAIRFTSKSIAREARAILRQHREPMRVMDILATLHSKGRTDISLGSLNSILSRLSREGKISHPEHAFYAEIPPENDASTATQHGRKDE